MASNIYGPAYSQGIKSLFLTSFFSITPSIFLKDTVAMFYFNLISVTGLMMYGSLISLTISPGFSFSTSKRFAKFPEQFIRLNSSRVDGITKMQGMLKLTNCSSTSWNPYFAKKSVYEASGTFILSNSFFVGALNGQMFFPDFLGSHFPVSPIQYHD